MARSGSSGNKKSNPSPPKRGVDLVARTVCEQEPATRVGVATAKRCLQPAETMFCSSPSQPVTARFKQGSQPFCSTLQLAKRRSLMRRTTLLLMGTFF
jgi:hypothetical protein